MVPRCGERFSTGQNCRAMKHMIARARAAPAGIRNCLSLLESAVLVDVCEERLRKDIERKHIVPRKGVCSPRLFFAWTELLPLAVIYKTDHMPATWRKNVWSSWEAIHSPTHLDAEPFLSTSFFDIGHVVAPEKMCLNIYPYLIVDFNEACKDIAPRINLYARGLGCIEEKEDFLNGSPVFKGTRISVINVGHMKNDGETTDNLLEDYPMLSKDDIEFAELYFLSHPMVGRPTKTSRLLKNDKPANR